MVCRGELSGCHCWEIALLQRICWKETDDEVVRVAAAEAVGRTVHDGEAIVDHVVFAGLVDHMPPQGQFDARVPRRWVGRAMEEDPFGRPVVIVVVGIQKLRLFPFLPPAHLAVIEDDIADIG